MIILHYHVQRQFKYELFHIHFTSLHSLWQICTQYIDLAPMCGFITQMVENCTGIAEVTGSNPVEALIFSGFLFPTA